MNDFSIIVKTFERPDYLDRFIDSVRKFYDVPILVADDSKAPQVRDDVEYYCLPFNSGVSKGRNFLIDKVKTKYFLQCDDDFVFTEFTDVELLLEKIGDFDILAGEVRNNGRVLSYYSDLVQDGSTITYVKKDWNGHVTKCDIVPFFFLAKTESLKGRYDDRFKTTEHFDFFWSNRDLKIGFIRGCVVDHDNTHNPVGYDEYRHGKRNEYLQLMFKKHNFEKLVALFETVNVAGNNN